MVRKDARRAFEPKKRRSFRSSPKLKKTEASLERARAQLRRMRAATKDTNFSSLQQAGVISAGGAIAGAASANFPEGFFGMSTPLAAGAGLVAGALVLENQNQKTAAKWATNLGAGMLAAWAAGQTEGMFG